jgi:hypothetical protein
VRTQSWRKAPASVTERQSQPIGSADDELEEEEGAEEMEIRIEDADPLTDSEETPMGGDPEYSDLLDTHWLERSLVLEDKDDDAGLGDIGFTLDLNGPDDSDELAEILDLDVGSLLTSLPEDELDLDGPSRESGKDGSFGIGALTDELLLPEDSPGGERADEAVGDDDRFPVFDDSLAVKPRPSIESDEDGIPDDEVPM